MLRRSAIAVSGRRGQRGLSIVEMMVGIAVGLFIVAAAAMLVSTQLTSNRRLLLDTQLQQDLRSTADIVTRELRRAGALSDLAAQQTVWYPGTSQVSTNLLAGQVTPSSGSLSQTDFQYQRGTTLQNRFALNTSTHVITTLVGTATQDLTDGNVLKVTSFTITPQNGAAIQIPCPNDCPGGGNACWPTLTVREFVVAIAGESLTDSSIQRSIRAHVRLRNDWVKSNLGGTPPPPDRICPL
jgi:type IV pilus assembly protein PilW